MERLGDSQRFRAHRHARLVLFRGLWVLGFSELDSHFNGYVTGDAMNGTGCLDQPLIDYGCMAASTMSTVRPFYQNVVHDHGQRQPLAAASHPSHRSMASVGTALAKKVFVAVICIMLVLPTMADVQDDCRLYCRPGCDGFSTGVCKGITKRMPILEETCIVRITEQCINTCVNLCSSDTLPNTPFLPCMGGGILFNAAFGKTFNMVSSEFSEQSPLSL
ncbi:hypothetical protein EJB05_26704, partial [Eragrostis curvula]